MLNYVQKHIATGRLDKVLVDNVTFNFVTFTMISIRLEYSWIYCDKALHVFAIFVK